MTEIKNEKRPKFKSLTAGQMILEIKANLDLIVPKWEGEAIALDIAKRLFAVFFDELAGPLATPKLKTHDKDVLFCFSFFLSHDSEFRFTRTYLNGKAEAYQACIDKTRTIFSEISSHFNRMIKYMGDDLQEYLLVYNEIFEFEYDKDTEKWNANLLYTNINRLVTRSKNVFQVYKKSGKRNRILIYTSELTKKTKEDRMNLKVIMQD